MLDADTFRGFVSNILDAYLADDCGAEHRSPELQNVLRLQDYYRQIDLALANRSRERLADIFYEFTSDDVRYEFVGPSQSPFSGVVVGRDEVIERVWNNFVGLDDQRPVLRRVIAQGDWVVLVLHETGVLTETGEGYESDMIQQFKLQDSQVVRFEMSGEFSVQQQPQSVDAEESLTVQSGDLQ